MDRPWMRLIEQGGDSSVGAALVRLARQATSVHLHEAARRVAEKSEEAGRPGGAEASGGGASCLDVACTGSGRGEGSVNADRGLAGGGAR